MNYFQVLKAEEFPAAMDQFFERYPEESGTIRLALERIGAKALAKVSRDLAAPVRVMAASGISAYSLAACGRVLSTITRSIESDMIATAVCGFVFGPGIDSKFGDQLIWSARWFEMGLPNLFITAQQAAAFCLTDVTAEQAEALRAPWPAFSITLETESFPVVLSDEPIEGAIDATGKSWCQCVAVMSYRGDEVPMPGRRSRTAPYWQVRLDVGAVQLWSGPLTADELCATVSHPWGPNGGTVAPDVLETRAVELGKLLAINVILAMENHGITKVKGEGSKGAPKGKFGLRANNDYVLGSPVKVNAIPAMHAFLTGEVNRAFKVRWVVRGHWRNQACGPGHADRTRKWIEPYWKGRDDAPIVIRDHEF